MDNNKFIQDLNRYMTTNRTITMGGDFNNIEYKLDQCGGDDNRRLSAQMATFKQTYGLVDAYRKLHRTGRTTTHTQQDILSRLDRFYLSSDLNRQ